jgi:hypothetical protein
MLRMTPNDNEEVAYPGCCHEEFCDDAWHHPFRVPNKTVDCQNEKSVDNRLVGLTFPPFPRPDIVL